MKFFRSFDVLWQTDWSKFLLGFEFPAGSFVIWAGPFSVWVLW